MYLQASIKTLFHFLTHYSIHSLSYPLLYFTSLQVVNNWHLQASYDRYVWRTCVTAVIASCSVRPLTKLAIKVVNIAKNIHNTHLICSYIHRYCFVHSFYGTTHGARAAGQYSYCPNHILGDMSIALALVSFTAYSKSARHFDPPTQ